MSDQPKSKTKIATIIEVEAKEGGFTRIYIQHEKEDHALDLFDKVRNRLKKEGVKV